MYYSLNNNLNLLLITTSFSLYSPYFHNLYPFYDILAFENEKVFQLNTFDFFYLNLLVVLSFWTVHQYLFDHKKKWTVFNIFFTTSTFVTENLFMPFIRFSTTLLHSLTHFLGIMIYLTITKPMNFYSCGFLYIFVWILNVRGKR